MIPYLTSKEVSKLKKAITGSNQERDRLVITMMYNHALRVSEVANLTWKNIDLVKRTLKVTRLHNGDSSVHFLADDEIKALKALRTRSRFVFLSYLDKPLTRAIIHKNIARAGEVIGLKVYPSILRHSKGYQLLQRGANIKDVQAYMGHKNIRYTTNYLTTKAKTFKGFEK